MCAGIAVDFQFACFAGQGGAAGVADPVPEFGGREEHDVAGVIDCEAEMFVLLASERIDGFAHGFGVFLIMEGVELSDSRCKGAVGEGSNSAVHVRPMDRFCVCLHCADFVGGVCEALHVDACAEMSFLLLVRGASAVVKLLMWSKRNSPSVSSRSSGL